VAQEQRQQHLATATELSITRQRLRQHLAAAAKPLAMSGWEDLIDEASADLERLEVQVSAAAQHLLELQVCGDQHA
jgi:hypothetical protein